MGVAYSNGPIVYRDMRGDTVANLLSDLHDTLTSVNWTPSAITGGYLYTVTSPQGFMCLVRIYDAGDGRVTVQFVSVDGAREGYLHKLDANTSYGAIGYKILANQCQMFVALQGITRETLSAFERNYSVAGGIPYVPGSMGGGDCSASAGTDDTSQIFWSCGEVNNDEFRSSRYCSGIFSVCWNDVIRVATVEEGSGPTNGTLQLYPFTMTEDVDVWYRTLPRITKYGSGEPMRLDPYIGWDFAIRGQLWDAFLISRDATLEGVITTSEPDSLGVMRSGDWLAWNYRLALGGRGGGGTYFATLYLLMDEVSGGSGGAVVNYAY